MVTYDQDCERQLNIAIIMPPLLLILAAYDSLLNLPPSFVLS